MRHSLTATLIAYAMTAAAAGAAEPLDKDYVRSLAAPGKTVLVMEYHDGQGRIAGRKGFASVAGFKPVSPTEFRVADGVAVRLYGIEPCQGDVVDRQEGFAGSCTAYAIEGLKTLLSSPKVIFCRAFVSEMNAAVQDATCHGYYHYPGALDTVDMFEEQLVSLGTHRIVRARDGTPARADLNEAEEIARRGMGMWNRTSGKAQ